MIRPTIPDRLRIGDIWAVDNYFIAFDSRVSNIELLILSCNGKASKGSILSN